MSNIKYIDASVSEPVKFRLTDGVYRAVEFWADSARQLRVGCGVSWMKYIESAPKNIIHSNSSLQLHVYDASTGEWCNPHGFNTISGCQVYRGDNDWCNIWDKMCKTARFFNSMNSLGEILNDRLAEIDKYDRDKKTEELRKSFKLVNIWVDNE